MAKPKKKYIVEIIRDGIHIYADNPDNLVVDLKQIEGITLITGKSPIMCYIDPRYDVQEIAREIRLLLNAEVPNAFR